jgi:hypothetical protein
MASNQKQNVVNIILKKVLARVMSPVCLRFSERAGASGE